MDEVQSQYERYPYPPRDPADERRRLAGTVLDSLALINFYGYQGRQDFSGGYRALVAGGGTGDAAIFLAEQLRPLGGQVVYIDISRASMAIARGRARVRGLENIEWHRAPLTEMPELGLEPFDFINCSGVLHHLEDPAAGLGALVEVLSDDGVIALMVYSRHMRAPVYQMQDLLRRVNAGVESPAERIRNARAVLKDLPPTNLFQAQIIRHKAELESGDAALYDLLLHARDRPFSVPELYRLLEGCGLALLEFVSPLGQKRYYRPGTFIRDPALLARLERLPRRERQAIADLIGLVSANHACYCARRPRPVAGPDDPDLVPFFFPRPEDSASIAAELANRIRQSRDAQPRLILELQFGSIEVPNDPLNETLAGLIDGVRTIGAIADAAARANGVSVTDCAEAFGHLFRSLNAIDWLLLRHRETPPLPSPEALQAAFAKRRPPGPGK